MYLKIKRNIFKLKKRERKERFEIEKEKKQINKILIEILNITLKKEKLKN